ncbi:hypothetical protein ATG98_2198 [Marinobacter sp. LV10R520-4]|uniref:hypothetical protein n=1 Tax=Marinobacter sp. LV10R520-4 TaxID=1761796 RepID=UPI000BF8C7AB|nr:hypothetical protein [Marinobacter sp. LV10R520-4]PFG53116.1 hypothetical protein ATG98_2198 [Marinobacter sp. LV10R520-4]
MTMNLEHQLEMKEIQLCMLLYGLGKKNGKVIPYPSAEYVRSNLLSSPVSNPMYLNISRKFECNAALKGDKSWELLAHWYIEGLAVEGYEKNIPNPLENATVKAKDLKHFLERSHYASPDWLASTLGLTNQATLHDSSAPQNVPKHLFTKEVNSLYRIILGMAIKKYKYDPSQTRNSATGKKAGSISADLEQAGLTVDSETISKHLKAAYSATPPESKS